MDNSFYKKIITDTFENSFDKDRFLFFIKNLLNNIDELKAFHARGYVKEKFKGVSGIIKTYERLGTYIDPNKKKIDILIVYLNKNHSLDKARTTLRNFMADYLKTRDRKNAGLVAFVPPNKTEWRFSFVKMDYELTEDAAGKIKGIEKFTPAKRYSFLVGENENSHTAKSRLIPILSSDKNPNLEDIEEGFSIEVVTKEFFEKYHDLFIRLKESLDKVVRNDKKVRENFESKKIDTVNFSKKLLGQIVFLYFLQKKGWFGVKRNQDWGSGSKQFLRELFEKKHGEYSNFFNDILEPLFYEALRNDRSYNDHYYSRFDCKIPFLNGGLFDPMENYDWINTEILIPDEIFSNKIKTKEGDIGNGILDIFNRYNFTVKEDEPLEKEVAVDPEMLGKVFENLLEIKDRKSKGTYYTPREIVHYMCQDSLINYLDSSLENNISRDDISFLIRHGETVIEHDTRVINHGKETNVYSFKMPNNICRKAIKIDEKLENIRICDPAVGSGAFPVGMMTEIIRARHSLSSYLGKGKNRSLYSFKRNAIQRCLYGVDIDVGAVEITKLRLWLSLVVDEDDLKHIKPLPNLDYKIVCGNSLLGVEKNLLNLHLFNELENLKHLYFKEINPTKKQEYKEKIDSLIYEITDGHREFDFEVYFSEVFNEKKGFDVIIANPPYLGESGNKELFRKIKQGILGQFYLGKMDLFYFFFHLALNIGKESANVAFITTNYYTTATGAKKLRYDFKQRTIIKNLINLNEIKIFESAKGQHNMITILKKDYDENAKAKTCITQRKGLASSFLLEQIFFNRDSETDYYEVAQNDLYDGNSFYIRLNGISSSSSNSIQDILDRIKKNGVSLGKLCRINQGIVSGCDYASGRNLHKLKNKECKVTKYDGIFVYDKKNKRDVEVLKSFSNKEKTLLKPFFKNSDIKKYWCQLKPQKYILYLSRKITSLQSFPNIKNHFNKFLEILNDRREVKNNRIKYFNLQWGRTEKIFTGPKIIVPYRSNINSFAYNECDWFCRSDSYVITQKDKSISLKYIIALLNSKLFFQWLFHRGKRKGNTLELFHVPLSEIPIKLINPEDQQPFINLGNKILNITEDDDYLENTAKQAQVHEYEKKIDHLAYKLYGLTPEEIKIVEESLSHSSRSVR